MKRISVERNPKRLIFLIISLVLLISTLDNHQIPLKDDLKTNVSIIQEIHEYELKNSPIHYSVHGPININGDFALRLFCAGTGNGTADEPWIIENFEIPGGTNGIYISNTNDYLIIRNCTIFTAGGGLNYAGIKLRSSNNVVIDNCTISDGRGHGIFLSNYNNNVNITNNVIYNNKYDGIWLARSDHNVIRDNKIFNHTYGVTSNGIYLQESDHVKMIDNNISFNYRGIDNYISYYNSFQNNYIHNNLVEGIDSYGSAFALTFINNTIFNNSADGIHLYRTSICELYNNNIFWNNDDGIELQSSNVNLLSGNNISYNNDYNIYDMGDDNIIWLNYFGNTSDPTRELVVGGDYWDLDGYGNYWENYEYRYPGASELGYVWNTSYEDSFGNKDNFPLTSYNWELFEPEIRNPPEDLGYRDFVLGHNIIWKIFDPSVNNPLYTVYRNNSAILSNQPWTSATETNVSIDGLASGVYNYTILVTDGMGGSTSDTVIVTIDPDNSPPIIIGSNDLVLVSGTPNQTIEWLVIDPSTFNANYSILINGIEDVTDQPWSSGDTIIVDVENLGAGNYNYTIVAKDGEGKISKDEIIVTVLVNNPPMVTQPSNIVYEFETIGNNIIWIVTDPSAINPYYTVYRNNSVILSNYFLFLPTEIAFSVDNLPLGIYNYTIVVSDGIGGITTDTVIVTVIPDSSPPIITGSDDLVFEYGTLGHTIDWYIIDPTTYNANYSILINGYENITDQPWISEDTIIVDVENLGVGEYNYTIVVKDGVGYICSDEIIVTVLENTPPSVVHLSDIVYEFGTTDNNITWIITDPSVNNPSYTVYCNNSIILSNQTWTSASETNVSIDGLTIGVYNYTIVVSDGIGDSITDTVIVTVIPDNSPPIITSSGDLEFEFGTPNHIITWVIIDPSTYNANYSILSNGIENIIDQPWSSGDKITVDVENLGVGEYNYTIVVKDGAGYVRSSEIIVTVLENTPPSITHLSDVVYEFKTTGNNITWIITDSSVKNPLFTVYRNTSTIIILNHPWTPLIEINVSVDGLSLGVYNYTIVVSDGIGDSIIDTVIVTVVPDNSPPLITSSGNLEFEFGTSNHLITWGITDPSTNNANYSILINGIEDVTDQPWSSGDAITVDIEDLGVGEYNYIIVVRDGVGNICKNEINVTVLENTPPSIAHLSDIVYDFETTGNNITWIITDLSVKNPLFTVYRDNSVIISNQPWTPLIQINISVDGLTIGVYNYTIAVSDGIGGSTTDTVIVTVVPGSLPAIDDDSDHITFEYGTPNHTITWVIISIPVNHGNYSILINGIENIIDQPWVPGDRIVVNVENLGVGYYNYTIVVTDVVGNVCSDEITVTVLENTPPTVSHPDDIEFIYGSKGYNLTWYITDLSISMSTYTILKNGSHFQSGSWVSDDEIAIILDDISVGFHNFTIVVNDGISEIVILQTNVKINSKSIPTDESSIPTDESSIPTDESSIPTDESSTPTDVSSSQTIPKTSPGFSLILSILAFAGFPLAYSKRKNEN